MVFKGSFREAGDSGSGAPGDNPKKQPASSSAGDDICRISPNDVEKLEPIIRTWVREAVEHSLSKILGPTSSSGSTVDSIGTSEEVCLELRFLNDLPSTLFTGSRIEAEDESPVEIELIDSRTGTRVTSGPLSSAKVSILVLSGDFDPNNREDWSEDKFNSNIVRQREGRRPLITGDLTINLREGRCCVSNVTFTDNSCWIRSRRFRLGARILQKVPIRVRVKEAASSSFAVKEHRGEVGRKHYPPRLQDAVWRLERISKGGKFHSRLASQGIYTVEDFLRLLEINPSLLRTIIGSTSGILSRTWEAIVTHARTCVLDDSQLFFYSRDSTNAGLLLDSVYRVVKVTFDGHTYLPVDELIPHQKVLMQNLKRQAHADVNHLVPVSWPLISGPPQPDEFLAPQEPLQMPSLGYRPASESTLSESEGIGNQQQEVSGPQKDQADQIFSPTAADSFTTGDVWSEPFNGENCFPGGPEVRALFSDENIYRIQISTCSPPASVWNGGDSFSFGSSSDRAGEVGTSSSLPNFGIAIGSSNVASPSFSVHVHGRNGRSRAAWCKIRAAFKFRSVGKVAARKRLSLLYAMEILPGQ